MSEKKEDGWYIAQFLNSTGTDELEVVQVQNGLVKSVGHLVRPPVEHFTFYTQLNLTALAKPTDYNGWKNKPTWLVYTYATDEASGDIKRIRRNCRTMMQFRQMLIDYISAWHSHPSGLVFDMWRWTIGEVDWDALAAHWWEDYKPE
jgi:hypothetical protein